MGLFSKKIKQEDILICIGKKDNENKLTIPFVEDLILYFVEDQTSAYRIITEKDFKKINLDLEDLIHIAKENTKHKIYKIYKEIPVRRNEEAQVIIPYDADSLIANGIYNFWTSLVLFDEFWNQSSDFCFEKNWDKYYIAMPYRTFLIIGNANNENSKHEITRLIDDYKKTRDNTLAQKLFDYYIEPTAKMYEDKNYIGAIEKYSSMQDILEECYGLKQTNYTNVGEARLIKYKKGVNSR